MTAATIAFERALAALVADDADAYAACFAEDGVLEWPFASGDLPRRVSGRVEIAAHVGQNLARSRAAGRRLTGPYDVRMHADGERCAVAELAVETAPGSPRLPYVHVYEVDDAGLITTLRDYASSAAMQLAETARMTEKTRALYATLDSRDWSQIAPLLAPGFTIRHGGGPPLDAEAWRAAIGGFHAAFPDGHHVLDEIHVAGDRVVTRARYVGTHRGPFRGVPATNQRVEIVVVHIDRFHDGLLLEHFGMSDASAFPRAS